MILNFYSAGKAAKRKFTFKTKSITRFVIFTLLLFDSAVCLPFKKENELILKHSGKVELRTTSDTTALKQHVHQEVVKITSNSEVEKETRKKREKFQA